MTTQNIHPGDIVFVEKKQGHKFYALVEGRESTLLRINPMVGTVTYRTASAREIKQHWRKSGKQ